MSTSTIFLHYLTNSRPLGYCLFFLAGTLESDGTLFTATFLARRGFFDLGDAVIVVTAAAFLADTFWYWMGRRFGPRAPRPVRWLMRAASAFDASLLKRPLHTIFISKFAYSLHRPLLFRLGELGVRPSLYVRNNFIATLGWMFVIGSLGYASGASFSLVKHYMKVAEIAVLLGLLLFFGFSRLLSWYSRRAL